MGEPHHERAPLHLAETVEEARGALEIKPAWIDTRDENRAQTIHLAAAQRDRDFVEFLLSHNTPNSTP